MLSLIRAQFDTLQARREQLTERFFRRSVLQRRRACIICSRLSVTSLSLVDCATQVHWNF